MKRTKLLLLLLLPILSIAQNDNYILYIDSMNITVSHDTVVLPVIGDIIISDPRTNTLFYDNDSLLVVPRDSHEVYDIRLGMKATGWSQNTNCSCYLKIRNLSDFNMPSSVVFWWKYGIQELQTDQLKYFSSGPAFINKLEIECLIKGTLNIHEISVLFTRESDAGYGNPEYHTMTSASDGTIHVEFDKTYGEPPHVDASIINASGIDHVSITNVTTTGCDLYCYRIPTVELLGVVVLAGRIDLSGAIVNIMVSND